MENDEEKDKNVELSSNNESAMAPDSVDKLEVEDPEIKVSASLMQQILDNQEKQEEQIKVLREAANQNKLISAENSRKPKDLPSAFLKVFMGKVVTSWRSDVAQLIYGNNGAGAPVGEILKATYFFSDGTDSGSIEQVMFTREDTRLVCRIIGQNGSDLILQPDHLETNNENLRQDFVMPPENLTVNQNFVNP